MSTKSTASTLIECDFCGRNSNEVTDLIAAKGNDVHICIDCVAKCQDVLNEAKRRPATQMATTTHTRMRAPPQNREKTNTVADSQYQTTRLPMLKATEYEILRGIEANGRINIPLERKPVRVATLLDENEFNRTQLMEHNRTVFFEDAVHDWNWSNGKFRYYTRIATKADVLIVYALTKVEAGTQYDTMTGELLNSQPDNMDLSHFDKMILNALGTRGGLTTGNVAKRVTPQNEDTARAHSTAVRSRLLQMEKAGLVTKLDDNKPVCWVKVSARK